MLVEVFGQILRHSAMGEAVVTSTRSLTCERSRFLESKSSTWARTGRISTMGSIRPVGRTHLFDDLTGDALFYRRTV